MSVPTPVPNLAGVIAVEATGFFSLALLADGSLRTWGSNQYGMIGDGTNFPRFTPSQVSGLQVVETPYLTASGRQFTNDREFTVQVSCFTPGAVMRYTVDGSEPTEESDLIASETNLRFDHTTTLKVKAWRAGLAPSGTAVGDYIFIVSEQRVNDASVAEPRFGKRDLVFVVDIPRLTQPTTINFRTVDGTARAGEDYESVAGTLTFAVGETAKMIQVPILADRISELSESFTIELHTPTNITLKDMQARGTITNSLPKARYMRVRGH